MQRVRPKRQLLKSGLHLIAFLCCGHDQALHFGCSLLFCALYRRATVVVVRQHLILNHLSRIVGIVGSLQAFVC